MFALFLSSKNDTSHLNVTKSRARLFQVDKCHHPGKPLLSCEVLLGVVVMLNVVSSLKHKHPGSSVMRQKSKDLGDDTFTETK